MERAEAIFASYGVIDVEYKNRPIWIENVNIKAKTADVKYLDEKNNIETVPVDSLVEK